MSSVLHHLRNSILKNTCMCCGSGSLFWTLRFWRLENQLHLLAYIHDNIWDQNLSKSKTYRTKICAFLKSCSWCHISYLISCNAVSQQEKGECTRCSSRFCWQPHQDGQWKSKVLKRHVSRNKQKPHKNTTDPSVCPEEWVNAQDVGCFLFLGEDPALSWFDASVACEQVPSPQSRKKGNILQTPNSRKEVISLSLCVSTKWTFLVLLLDSRQTLLG